MSRWTESLSSLALAVGSLLFALGAAETIARACYEPPWTESLLGAQASERPAYPDQHGALGLRDEPLADAATRRRILVLGDSFTYGSGVRDREGVFVERLQRALSAATDTGVDVLNAGVPGSLTGDWLSLHDRVVPGFDPHVVLVVFFLRDGTLTHSMGEFFDPIRRELVGRNRRSVVYQRSYLYRTFRDRADRRLIGERYGSAIHSAYFGDEAQTAEWRRAQANLLALRDRARAAGRGFGLVVFPFLVRLDESHPFLGEVETVVAFGEENGLPVHSLLPAFLGQDAASLWVSPLDQHPNQQGHRIAAESMRPFVAKLLLESGDR